jgi:hypothetical protein
MPKPRTNAKTEPPARRMRDVAVGHMVRGLIETEAQRKGVLTAQVIGLWPRICPMLAAWSHPAEIRDGVLRVVVDSDAVKQELLYLTPQIVEGVNLLLGFEGVRKVTAVTRHGLRAGKAPAPKMATPKAPGDAAVAKAKARCKDVRDPELRQALERLGAQIYKGK